MTHPTRNERRLAVRVKRQNRQYPEAVILETERCPYCNKVHQHGSMTAQTNADGTYGPRVPHCGAHRHQGQREWCQNDHPQYTLVPVRTPANLSGVEEPTEDD